MEKAYPEIWDDYKQTISEPVCFEDLRNVSSAKEFWRKLKLISGNCIMYNKGGEIYEAAVSLGDDVATIMHDDYREGE